MAVLLTTNHGNITIELDAEKAPKTVENFLAYVKPATTTAPSSTASSTVS
jgi:cyclophilin family peptidyl-prolyl cis-trans isomerase